MNQRKSNNKLTNKKTNLERKQLLIHQFNIITIMKKYYFILAAAALGFASCSSDETIAESQGLQESNEIGFRTFVSGNTRAADVTQSNLNQAGGTFYATARHTVDATTTTYFDNVPFVYNTSTSTFNSDTKYYWPAAGTLDFFAYTPAVKASELARTDYKTFTVTPSTTVASQLDLVFANTDGKTKETSSAGVPINFRHAQSKIVVKVKNSGTSNLKFEITGMKIVNVDGSATFTYNDVAKDAVPTPGDGNTDGSGTLLVGDWTENTTYTAKYSTAFTTNTVSAKQDESLFLNGSGTIGTEDENLNMILIPQTTPNVTTSYSAATLNAPYTGSYIALKMVVKDKTNNVVIADATTDVSDVNKWAMWPVKFTWEPGKKYTYTIDLAGGGYWELNNDTDADLDQVLESAEIKFVTVTVDAWDPQSESAVTFPLP